MKKISEDIYYRIKEGKIRWSGDGYELLGNLKFDKDEDESVVVYQPIIITAQSEMTLEEEDAITRRNVLVPTNMYQRIYYTA